MDILDMLSNPQEARIGKSEERIESATLTLETLKRQIADAFDRIDHANLVTIALWELIAERLGLTVEQIRARVSDIDLRDGVHDGRYGGDVPCCTGCGRQIRPKRTRCMYCGLPRRGLGLIDSVSPNPDTTE